MRIPVEAVRRMKREFQDPESMCRMAKQCGLKVRLTQIKRYWHGDMRDTVALEGFLLMIGLKLKVEEVS